MSRLAHLSIGKEGPGNKAKAHDPCSLPKVERELRLFLTLLPHLKEQLTHPERREKKEKKKRWIDVRPPEHTLISKKPAGGSDQTSSKSQDR